MPTTCGTPAGRPKRIPDAVRAQVIALACELPATSGVPLSRWSNPELARELTARCQVRVSESTVRRWLDEDALKPWQHRSWISIRDPDFEAKAARVLDLYALIWDGQPLGPNDFVICADDKTSIQARCRGQVIGRCEDTTGIEPFSRLVDQVMTVQTGHVGVREPGHRLLPAQVLLDPDRPAPDGRGRGVPGRLLGSAASPQHAPTGHDHRAALAAAARSMPALPGTAARGRP
jgi:hypothetical protein